MASFLGSIFGFEFGAKIYLFWRLWQVIPDCVGRDRMRAEWVVAALLWFYKHDSGSFALKQIPCHRLLHDGVSMSWHMLPSRLQDDAAELQRYFQVSPKLLGFGEACFGVLKVSCCGVASWALRNLATSVVNDLDLLSGYVVGVACLHRENPCRRICMQLASRTSWSSVLYLSFLFAMLCSSSFGCIFICTNPKQTLLMSARSSFHWGMSTFLVTPSMCCVFICTNSRHALKTSLCCAFYWRTPCHDHTFDLLCFHMYKPQSNLNSRQRTKPRVAARKKKKLIELSLKSCRACWHRPAP